MFMAIAFESSVVLDGTKTSSIVVVSAVSFESSVVLDGTKTARQCGSAA